MRILLTGNKGFIGSYIQEALQHAEHEVVTLDVATDIAKWRTAFMILNPQKIDLVIHCGAIADSSAKGNHLWRMNYETTKELAEWVIARNTRMLYISSCVAADPQNPYGWTKRAAEDIVSRTILPRNISIFRLFNVWALNEPAEKANRSIISKLITQDLTHVYRDCARYFVHVTDVASAVLKQVETWTPGIFEIRTTELTILEDFVNRVYAYQEIDEVPVPKPTVIDCPVATEIPAYQQIRLPDWEAKTEVRHKLTIIRAALVEKYIMRGISESDPEYENMLENRQREQSND